MSEHFDKLPPRYQLFVGEYVESNNLSKAARKAGSKAKNISQAGKDLLKRPDIQRAVREFRDNLAKEINITADSVLREMARIGFCDLRNILDEDGNIKKLQDMPPDVTAAISSIEVVTNSTGDKVEYIKKIRTWDKKGALESLAKHLGLFEKDNEQRNPFADLSREDLLQKIKQKIRVIEREKAEAKVH